MMGVRSFQMAGIDELQRMREGGQGYGGSE